MSSQSGQRIRCPIRLNAGDDVKEYLVEKGYDEKYGARPLKRTIQNLIEDKLAEAGPWKEKSREGRFREDHPARTET